MPNHFPLFGRLKFLKNNDLDPFGYCLGAKLWEYPHIRFFTYESIEEMLSISGFRIKRNLSYHFPTIPFIHRLSNRLGGKLIRILAEKRASDFCGGFTVLAEKKHNIG